MLRTTLPLLLLFPLTAATHHSRAEFEGETELSGVLVGVEWRNPHPAFTVEVGDGAEAVRWTVEGWSSLNTFGRSGITRDQFQIGDRISVFGLVSQRRKDSILGTHMLLGNGTEAILRKDADPYWGNANILGGRRNWEADTRSAVVNAAEENRGLFRVWSYPTPNYRTAVHQSLTDYAKAAQAQWDQVDNYLARCEQKGMPGSMNTTSPYEFIDAGDGTIVIRGYQFDVVRTVHMQGAKDPATVPSSIQGYSIGHWEDDGRTLVIQTSRIDFPYLGISGIPLSEDVAVTERYSLSADQARLDFHMSVTDPLAFTEPATYEFYWLALGEEFGAYDCRVE